MQTIQMTLRDAPQGYEYTGEFRRGKFGEYILTSSGPETVGVSEGTNYDYPILRKLPPAFKKGGVYVNGEIIRIWDGEHWRTPYDEDIASSCFIPTGIATIQQVWDYIKQNYDLFASHVWNNKFAE